MTVEERKRKQILHMAIINAITNCETDKEMFQNLLWAQEIITNELLHFDNFEVENHRHPYDV